MSDSHKTMVGRELSIQEERKTAVQRKKKEWRTRSYACNGLNLGYFRVLRNSTNQADREAMTKGEEGGKKRDARHYNQEPPDSETKISSGHKVFALGLQPETNKKKY